VKYALSNE